MFGVWGLGFGVYFAQSTQRCKDEKGEHFEPFEHIELIEPLEPLKHFVRVENFQTLPIPFQPLSQSPLFLHP